MSSSDNDDVMQLFIEESREHLEGIEENLLRIEQTAHALEDELVNAVFRTLHTIKGGAGFFALTEVKNLAHVMENILDAIRRRELVPTPAIVSELLDSSDLLRRMINDIDASRGMDISGNLARLHAVMDTPVPTGQEQAAAVQSTRRAVAADGTLAVHSLIDNRVVFTLPQSEVLAGQIGERGGVYVYLLEFDCVRDLERNGRRTADWLAEFEMTARVIRLELDRARLESGELGDSLPAALLCTSIIEPDIMRAFAELPEESVQLVADSLLEDAPEEPAPAARFAPIVHEGHGLPVAAPMPAAGGDAPAPRQGGKDGEQSVRVGLRLLERLMNLAGELVLSRNALLQSVASGDPEQVRASSHGVDAITSQLQEAIIATRMQTVGIVFGKFRRIVRDLSAQLGKKVQLEIHGEDVDLDKTVIEAIGDPLTHLVRNSLDHGIETPARRLAAGKPEEGRLLLNAVHEAGQVVIEIRDDGAGIDPVRLRAKALEKGLCTRDELDRMSDKEACRLIFKPGFSTADKVTEISGRGVGMDVVQQNLARVGGVIDLDSAPGRGTTIRIKLPLTLAIIPSVLVSAGDERFAIPQVNLVELVRIAPGEVRTRLERLGESAVLRLRGDILPVVSLGELLDLAGAYHDPLSGDRRLDRRARLLDRRAEADAAADAPPRERGPDRRQNVGSAINLVILAAGQFKYGMVVDEMLDSVEIVVKPLGRHFKGCIEYAGATILGDGTVATILDVAGIREAMALRETRQLETRATEAELQFARAKDQQSVLIVENGAAELFAVPAQLVTRIEKIPAESVQEVGGRKAVSYRGQALQLLPIEAVGGCTPRAAASVFYAVVFTLHGREVGLMAADVHDIAQVTADIDDQTYRRPGIMGSFLRDECIVQMLDPHEIVGIAAPELARELGERRPAPRSSGTVVLLVEDSPFFRRQIQRTLEEAGYEVIATPDGEAGLAALGERTDVRLVVSDVEMPRMDGLSMVRAIRADPRWRNLPVIAVTSLAGSAAEDVGLEAGFTEYHVKLDRDRLIEACARLC